MAKDPFDFSDVFTDLENKINNFMQEKATHEVAQRMFAETTYEYVYAKYSPSQYERRYDAGGLADFRNYEVQNDDKMSMTIFNNTYGNAFCQGEGWNAGFITELSIEPGINYNWRQSGIYQMMPYPRPFMDKALDHFTDDYLMPTIHDTFFND